VEEKFLVDFLAVVADVKDRAVRVADVPESDRLAPAKQVRVLGVEKDRPRLVRTVCGFFFFFFFFLSKKPNPTQKKTKKTIESNPKQTHSTPQKNTFTTLKIHI
jgi:hypothetical protein